MLLTKKDILDVVTKDVSLNNPTESGLYCLLQKKLGNEAIDELEKRLLSVSEDYTLNSIIEVIYEYKPKDESSIISHLGKNEKYFVGKTFQLADPNGNESTISEIESCSFFFIRKNIISLLNFL